MRVVVDGYNLIFQCGLEGKRRTPLTLERGRKRLLQLIAAHVAEPHRSAITVVFDAKRLPIRETQARSQVNGVHVWFAIDEPDADSLIERVIQRHSHPKSLTVVSSDNRLKTAATRKQAMAVDSDAWLDQLESGQVQQSLMGDSQTTDKAEAAKQLPPGLENVDWASLFTGPSPSSGSSDSDEDWARIFEQPKDE